MEKVVIVGGGASGIFAALSLKKNSAVPIDVVILEIQSRIGKKLLATGNGKCNLSNVDISSNHYNTPLVRNLLEKFTSADCRKIFADMGLLTRVEEGRIYPYSEKATTVLDLFMRELQKLHVRIEVDYQVSHIKKADEFIIYAKDHRFENADYVIMATGGASAINFSNQGYKMATYLGHSQTVIRPGLVALKTKENVKSLSGLRIKCGVSLYDKSKLLAKTQGEVLFKDQGISGIAIFELSRYFNHFGYVDLDLVNTFTDKDILEFLSHGEISEQLHGIVPKMLATAILKRIDEATPTTVLQQLRQFRLTVIDTYGLMQAQVTLGGIEVREINPLTFASLKTKDLYLVGEMLDVDGTCGGFNLHFAWGSAYLAAQDIIKNIIQNKKGEANEST